MTLLRFLIIPLFLWCSQVDSQTRSSNVLTPRQQEPSAETTIPVEGGSVELEGVGRAIFPAGAFERPQPVSLRTTDTPQTEAGRTKWDVSVGPPGTPLAYDVRINSGQVKPTKSFEVVLTVPEAYMSALPPNHIPQLFAQIVSGGGQQSFDNYHRLDAEFDPALNEVRAEIPLGAIRGPRKDDHTFETILVIGSGPAPNPAGQR